MPKTYSIAEAKNQFTRLMHEVEDAGPIEVTRRGKPVAVVLSLDAYQRLVNPKRSLAQAIAQFRSKYELDDLDIDPDELTRDTRSQDIGGEFSW